MQTLVTQWHIFAGQIKKIKGKLRSPVKDIICIITLALYARMSQLDCRSRIF